MNEPVSIDHVADRLAALYGLSFGGKPSGRFRIPEKLVRKLWRRKRLYENDIQALTRAMFERGYVLVSMDGFMVVLSANSFVNYRRANDESVV